MGWFSMLFKSFPEGCRESMRVSYQNHYSLAQAGKAPVTMDPHQAGLFGALATRYKARGVLPRFPEVVLWSELAPFLLMAKEEALEALTEYVLWQEHPAAAKKPWLAAKINQALCSLPSDEKNSFQSLAPMAFLNKVKWCDLLNPSSKSTLAEEAKKL